MDIYIYLYICFFQICGAHSVGPNFQELKGPSAKMITMSLCSAAPQVQSALKITQLLLNYHNPKNKEISQIRKNISNILAGSSGFIFFGVTLITVILRHWLQGTGKKGTHLWLSGSQQCIVNLVPSAALCWTPSYPCRFSPLFHRTQWAMAAGAQTNGAVVAEAFQKVEAFLPSAEWVGRKGWLMIYR